jgi:hypothetical protein
MKRIIWVAFLLLLPVLVQAQFRTQTGPVNLVGLLNAPVQMERAAAGLLGLDLSRLHIYQSYQMNYISAGSTGYSQGVYLNTMTYDFKIPLSVAVQWGIAHQPLAGKTSSLMKDGPFLSAAQLRYQPAKDFLIQLDYVQNPYRYNQNPYSYPGYRGW